jgi:hypothetical protein
MDCGGARKCSTAFFVRLLMTFPSMPANRLSLLWQHGWLRLHEQFIDALGKGKVPKTCIAAVRVVIAIVHDRVAFLLN